MGVCALEKGSLAFDISAQSPSLFDVSRNVAAERILASETSDAFKADRRVESARLMLSPIDVNNRSRVI